MDVGFAFVCLGIVVRASGELVAPTLCMFWGGKILKCFLLSMPLTKPMFTYLYLMLLRAYRLTYMLIVVM